MRQQLAEGFIVGAGLFIRGHGAIKRPLSSFPISRSSETRPPRELEIDIRGKTRFQPTSRGTGLEKRAAIGVRVRGKIHKNVEAYQWGSRAF